jgi:predicted DNA binding protein
MLRRVSLTVNEESLLQREAAESDSSIKVLDCKDFDKYAMSMLLSVSNKGGRVKEVLHRLKKAGFYEKAYSSGTSDETICVTTGSPPPFCKAVLDAGVLCTSCPYNSSGSVRFSVLVKDSGSVRRLVRGLENTGHEVSIDGVSGVEHRNMLTPRQNEVLMKAVSAGYFEFPRKTGLTQLASELALSPPALSELLRIAQKKIIADYMAQVLSVGLPRSDEFGHQFGE